MKPAIRLLTILTPSATASAVTATMLTLFSGNIPILYDFSTGSGSTVTNQGEGGATYNGTIAGGVTWVAAPSGSNLLGGVDIDGLTGYISHTVYPATPSYTVIMCAYADNGGEGGNGRYVTNGAVDRAKFNSGTNFQAFMDTDATDGTFQATSEAIITANHINFTEWNASLLYPRAWYSNNGGAVTEYSNPNTAGTGSRVTPTGTAYVGNASAAATQTWDGKFYLYAVINRVLTAGERTQVKNLIQWS